MFHRIENEITLLQRVQHQNVVKCFGWTTWETGMAIITEYLPGGNLGDLLFNLDIPISPLLKLRLSADISNGIAYIHEVKLVHGDIKTANILLTTELRCKIGDFGGSRLEAYSASTKSTKSCTQFSNEMHVTLQYAAPETLEYPLNTLKHAHDIFGFSIVEYEILARNRPAPYRLLQYLYQEAIRAGHRPDLSCIELEEQDMLAAGNKNDYLIVNSLKHIMRRCWSHDPSNRPEMSFVHMELYYLLYVTKLEDQEKAVHDTLAYFKMHHPSFDECATATISELTL